MNDKAITIKAAYCDYSGRGCCRPHWFRMVYRNNQWQYFGDRLNAVGTSAATRHQTAHGDVWEGELLAQHARSKGIDTVYLVGKYTLKDGTIKHLKKLEFGRTRDGGIAITMPDGTTITTPDPRKR